MGKRQADCYLVDEFDDAVGPDVAGLQFALSSTGQRSSGSLTKPKERPVAHLIGYRPVLAVVVELLDRLGLLEAIADVGEERLAGLHLLGNRINPRITRFIRTDGGRVAAIDHTEQRLVERCLVGRVVDVLRPRQPAQPLSGTIAGEAAQIHDDDSVGCFGLAVRLGVERRRHVQLRAHEAHELAPERRGEDRVAVLHDRLGDAV